MSLAPVIVFGYNREDHLKQTIDALGKNVGAKETDIFLFLDGFKGEEDQKKVETVQTYGKSLTSDPRFRSITVFCAEYNRGLALSVIQGVSRVIERYGRVIVLEDDIISSQDYLSFMNDALNYYETEDSIWSISGYTFNLISLKNVQEDVYLGYRASSWGWATWKNRWISIDWNVSDYNLFRYNILSRVKFNRGGTDMSDMLDRQMAGEISSWAIRWCYAQFRQNKLTVFPCKSKVLNIGQDGTGTHSDKMNQYDSNQFGNHEYTLTLPPINRVILREFKNRVKLSLFSRIKRYMIYNIIRRIS